MKRGLILLALSYLLIACAGLLLVGAAKAAPVSYWANLGGVSAHDSGHYNGANPGVGLEVRTSDSLAFFGGLYHNSEWRTSRYLGVSYTPWRLPLPDVAVHVGIQVGAVDGYPLHDGKPIPAAALVADVRLSRAAFQLTYLPAVRPLNYVNTLALAVKVRF